MKTKPPKRYTVFTFPALYGAPRYFRFKATAMMAAFFTASCCEILDNETGAYFQV